MSVPRPDVRLCHLVQLTAHEDKAGALVPMERGAGIPFTPQRVFTVTGVSAGSERGGHANAVTTELLLCLSGRVEVGLDDGRTVTTYVLDDPRVGLVITPMVWVSLRIVADRTVLLAMCDTTWREAEPAYFRDRAHWLGTLTADAAA